MNAKQWNTMTDEQRTEWIKAQPYSRGKIHRFDEPARSNKPPSRRDLIRAGLRSRKFNN